NFCPVGRKLRPGLPASRPAVASSEMGLGNRPGRPRTVRPSGPPLPSRSLVAGELLPMRGAYVSTSPAFPVVRAAGMLALNQPSRPTGNLYMTEEKRTWIVLLNYNGLEDT